MEEGTHGWLHLAAEQAVWGNDGKGGREGKQQVDREEPVPWMLPYRQWEVPAGFCQQVGNGFVETSSDGDVETERRPVRKATVAPMKA